MKTILITLFISTILISFNSSEKLQIDTNKSQIKWSCDYVFYFSGHHGTIDFQEGYFIKENDVIVGGEFIIDMNSIVCLDIEDQGSNQDLVDHIKDPDFFDVTQFPKSKLSIKSVKYRNQTTMEIWADLEIKNIIKPVRFQATVDYELEEMTTKFKIDRTLWGITYNSNIKDGAISDAIGFEVKLKL